jgi:hypothetical protein
MVYARTEARAHFIVCVCVCVCVCMLASMKFLNTPALHTLFNLNGISMEACDTLYCWYEIYCKMPT